MAFLTGLFSFTLIIIQLNTGAVTSETDKEYDNIKPEPESILDDLIALDYVDKYDITEEDINGVHDLVGMISNSELSSEESYEYESVEDGEDIVLIVDVSPVDFEEYDYNFPTSDVQFVKSSQYYSDYPGPEYSKGVKDAEYYADYPLVKDAEYYADYPLAVVKESWVHEVANYDYYPSEDVNLETVITDDNETLLDYPHMEDGISLSETTKSLKITINEIYKQQKILHIILLLGICLIVLVMLLAVVSLVVSMISRRPDVNNNSIRQVEGVRQIKLKNSGIVRSYAKVPVEIKNMLSSNVAYKPLYEV